MFYKEVIQNVEIGNRLLFIFILLLSFIFILDQSLFLYNMFLLNGPEYININEIKYKLMNREIIF